MITKKRNLTSLSAEDQKHILALCEKHTFTEVAALLALPRDQGGLDLETSRSALHRFYSQNAWIVTDNALLQQFIDVIRANTQVEDVLPLITRLMGQFTFLQMARRVPFENYKMFLNTFMRLEQMTFRKQKWQHTLPSRPPANNREMDHLLQAMAGLEAALTPDPEPEEECSMVQDNPSDSPEPQPVPPIPPFPAPSHQPIPATPIHLEAPAQSSPKNPGPLPAPSDTKPSHNPDISHEKPRNPAHPTKSHLPAPPAG